MSNPKSFFFGFFPVFYFNPGIRMRISALVAEIAVRKKRRFGKNAVDGTAAQSPAKKENM